ncbi:RagB/SusD family nutrient uptake outer membrane protein [Fulvivirgaceae bacterium BMA10]|uniref:RagB/SusD family nutrient uptake outer membrane protein n=1 Tax=Splendidivirga corallicola TaxID=3051826 RepID=A0ABT8KHW8_9BACT|nr:RagB/SusD family nutrient uptake outer membrane protein [Fulvivirgaceae bacterium BMA10]
MKKLNRFLIICFTVFTLNACEDRVLNLDNPSSPTDAAFFASEDQLEVALAGIYASANYTIGVPFTQALDHTTDLGFSRGNVAGTATVTTGGMTSTNGLASGFWNRMYLGIQRSNNLLNNMSKAEENTDPARFEEIRGEALFLRAFFYGYLIELFGDVPYRTEVATSLGDLSLPRASKAEIVTNILSDLETAAGLLPATWGAGDRGRASAMAAQTLRARVALYNENWSVAEEAAEAVINSGAHSLFSDYEALFTAAGSGSEEVIFDLSYQEGTRTHNLPRRQGTRFGGWAQFVPSQQTVDSYETTNGLPIDEDPAFDPANPYDNRDPRLKASIVVPGEVWTGRVFETHSDSVATWVVEGGVNTTRTLNLNSADFRGVTKTDPVSGQDFTTSGANEFGAYTGYNWKKFSDEPALMGDGNVDQSELSIIIMRYGEVLLTYAEAKIEGGSIDQSVLDAINDVRARAYGTDRGDVANYPAVTTTDQSELRKIIRRERKVELANEGFRLFDIRRWRTAEKVMNGILYGSPANGWSQIGGTLGFVPAIDDDGFIDYTGAPSQPRAIKGNLDYREVEVRLFNPARDYLWAVPQSEIDATEGLVTQNPGGY